MYGICAFTRDVSIFFFGNMAVEQRQQQQFPKKNLS